MTAIFIAPLPPIVSFFRYWCHKIPRAPFRNSRETERNAVCAGSQRWAGGVKSRVRPRRFTRSLTTISARYIHNGKYSCWTTPRQPLILRRFAAALKHTRWPEVVDGPRRCGRAKPLALTGTLREFGLVDLLSLVRVTRKSGVLSIHGQ